MKNIIFTAAALCLAVNAVFAQPGWYATYSVTSNSLESVFFTDANTGYAIGYSLLLKTTNAGESWFQPTTQYLSILHDVFFIDNNTGFIAEEFDGDGPPPPYGWISKTTNGGYNWFHPTQGVEGAILLSLHFVNSNTGFGVGYRGSSGWWYSSGGSKYKTTDGGNVWFRIDNDGDTTCSYTSVHFLNENTGYIIRRYCSTFLPNILKTTNGGTSWIELLPNTWSQLLNCVYFLDVNTGFACGNGIIMTTNGVITGILRRPEDPLIK